jgi:putative phage-type endonuclease
VELQGPPAVKRKDKELLTTESIAEIQAKSTATWLGSFTPDNPEWHELRSNRIGGSEVGAIVGASKYESAYSLWAKKLGLISDEVSDNEFMYWGRALEPVVIDRFELDHPELRLLRDVGTWVHRERDFHLANPDAIYQKPDGSYGVLEIKTARYSDDWQFGVPQYYMTQIQWYLSCFGFAEAYVAVLFAGSEYKEFYVQADKFWQESDLEKVNSFLECIRTETQPVWDGAESTVMAVRQQHPDIDAKSEVELGELGLHYSSSLDDLETAKSKVNELQARVLDAMGSAKTGIIYDTPAFVRSSRKGGTPYLTRKRGA